MTTAQTTGPTKEVSEIWRDDSKRLSRLLASDPRSNLVERLRLLSERDPDQAASNGYVEHIIEHGWTVVSVAEDRVIYTLGLNYHFGHPELLVWSPDAAYPEEIPKLKHLLNQLGQRVASGSKIGAGTSVDALGKTLTFNTFDDADFERYPCGYLARFERFFTDTLHERGGTLPVVWAAEEVDPGREIARFFEWFAAEPAKWPLPRDDYDDQALSVVHERLSQHFPELTPNVSWTPKAPFEIQFSAKLKPACAPVIRAIEKAAPKLKNWKFTAFQPPLGFYDLYVAHLGLPYDQLPVKEVRVELLAGGPPWRLKAYVPKYQPKKRDAFVTALQLLLEAGMGERWLLEDLGSIDVDDRKRAPVGATAIDELSALTSRKKASPAKPKSAAKRSTRAKGAKVVVRSRAAKATTAKPKAKRKPAGSRQTASKQKKR